MTRATKPNLSADLQNGYRDSMSFIYLVAAAILNKTFIPATNRMKKNYVNHLLHLPDKDWGRFRFAP